jgi:hypothetical protein
MSIYTSEIVQGYMLEIISRSEAVKAQAKNLLSKHFASDAPCNLANTICSLCSYLRDVTEAIYSSIDWRNPDIVDSNVAQLQITDVLIRILGEHIQYLDNAQTHKLPWSLILPMKTLVRQIMPEIEIILQPQWEYNYTIQPTSLYEMFYGMLTRYQSLTPERNVGDLLSGLNRNYYVVSFPACEKNNILLHSLLAHEIGHLKSKDYFDGPREEQFLQAVRDKVAPIVENQLKEVPEDMGPLFQAQVTQELTQTAIKRITTIWQRGLEELLSDMIGCFLLGPAVLFANMDFALQDLNGFDTKPTEDNLFYPPWRMRLRNILVLLKDLSILPVPRDKFQVPEIADAVNRRLHFLEEIASNDSDKKEIEDDAYTKIAYVEIEQDLQEAKPRLRKELSSLISTEFYDRLPHLVERLELGIPPNAWEISIDERQAATVLEIINAAWFHKLSWSDSMFDKIGNAESDIYKKRSRMNRLTLKALEYAFIENEYMTSKGVDSGVNDIACGVLEE